MSPTQLDPGAEPRATELHFAVLARPAVQMVRFLGKAALAWFLSAEQFGAAALAGLLVFVVFRIAYLSLDEVLLSAHDPDAILWRRLRRAHHAAGAAALVLLLAVGSIAVALGGGAVGWLLVVLAPSVWVSNLAVLPTALLARGGRYRALFALDLSSTVALAACSLGAAAGGLGAWSLVAGWWANALVCAFLAARLGRGLVPRGASMDSQPRAEAALRRGFGWTGAAAIDLGAERLDSLSVGLWLGRGALGLYEWALHLASFGYDWASNLGERVLLPALSRMRREADGAEAPSQRAPSQQASTLWLRCSALSLAAHGLLALAAAPAVRLLFPNEWHPAGALVALLMAAAGMRTVELFALLALKVEGATTGLVRLSLARLALVAAVLPWGLARGAFGVAVAVVVARTLGAALTVAVAWRAGRVHQMAGSFETLQAVPEALPRASTDSGAH